MIYRRPGTRGVKSYEGERAWSSINHSILSGIDPHIYNSRTPTEAGQKIPSWLNVCKKVVISSLYTLWSVLVPVDKWSRKYTLLAGLNLGIFCSLKPLDELYPVSEASFSQYSNINTFSEWVCKSWMGNISKGVANTLYVYLPRPLLGIRDATD